MTMEIDEINITDGLNKMLYDKLKKENKKLKKQLKIAIYGLKWYAQPKGSLTFAQDTLNQIKELDK